MRSAARDKRLPFVTSPPPEYPRISAAGYASCRLPRSTARPKLDTPALFTNMHGLPLRLHCAFTRQ